MQGEHQNFKAGLFVLIGSAAALAVVFILADLERLFERSQAVSIRYELDDGVQGLMAGADVTLGHVPVGTVQRIEDLVDPESGRVVAQRIVAGVPRRYALRQDAVFELDVPMIGTGTKLNIRDVGRGEPYDPATTIQGRVAASALVGQAAARLGIQARQREQIQAIVSHVESITGALSRDIPVISAELREVVAEVRTLLDDAKKVLADLGESAGHVREVTADIGARRKVWVEKIDNIAAKIDDTATGLSRIVDENAAPIGVAIENLHAITDHMRQQTLAQVDEAIDKAKTALAHLESSAGEIRAMVVGQRPVLERAFANAQLTTDQLKLAAIEVRRSPWRLLYEPDEKELESDNLYDAARSFALAAGTLDAAVQGLGTYAERRPDDADRIGAMLDQLEALFEKFEQAEQTFWSALKAVE